MVFFAPDPVALNEVTLYEGAWRHGARAAI